MKTESIVDKKLVEENCASILSQIILMEINLDYPSKSNLIHADGCQRINYCSCDCDYWDDNGLNWFKSCGE